MPLRDHFRPPLDDLTSWEGLHGGWPMVIVTHLSRILPQRYVASPRVHLGADFEIVVATYEKDSLRPTTLDESQSKGGVATAVWAPPRPTLSVTTDLPSLDEYEVRAYGTKRGRRLVAAVELVRPANEDRPEHRYAFIAKCIALLQNRVCVTIVDLVTTRNFNLYAEVLEFIGQTDPSLGSEPPCLYAMSCRPRRTGETWLLEGWAASLMLGQPLPTLPLWLSEELAVPLNLEASYEEACSILRIP